VNTNVFDEWRDQPLDGALAACRDLVEDPDYPTVRRWRENGGKVAGHFQVYFPEEIVHAAGMLPVKMRGAPVEPTRADSHFGSYLCSILKTSLEIVLTIRSAMPPAISPPSGGATSTTRARSCTCPRTRTRRTARRTSAANTTA
jgi:hypothetical protein